jgi:hypothetical protein
MNLDVVTPAGQFEAETLSLHSVSVNEAAADAAPSEQNQLSNDESSKP